MSYSAKDPTLEKKLCKLTPKIPIEMSKDNIYRKHCTECTATYIGESELTMKQRDTLHRSDIRTGKTRCALYTHIKNNKGHNDDWEKKEVLTVFMTNKVGWSYQSLVFSPKG